MNNLAIQILAEQLENSHGLFKATMNGVTNEVAAATPPGIANSIASTYAHILICEDYFIHTLLQDKKTLLETDFENETGMDQLVLNNWKSDFQNWPKDITGDIEQMNQYAEAVFAASESYIKSLTDEDLQRELQVDLFNLGQRTVAFVLGSMLISNLNNHLGEISTLKGIQGLKGYPV